MDKNNSNTLSAEEFRAVVTNLGGRNFKHIIKTLKPTSEKPLTNEEVDEILTMLGLRDDQEIPIEQIIDLFTVE